MEYKGWEVNVRIEFAGRSVDMVNYMDVTQNEGNWRALVIEALSLQVT